MLSAVGWPLPPLLSTRVTPRPTKRRSPLATRSTRSNPPMVKPVVSVVRIVELALSPNSMVFAATRSPPPPRASPVVKTALSGFGFSKLTVCAEMLACS